MKKVSIFLCLVSLGLVLPEMIWCDFMANPHALFGAISRRPSKQGLAKGKFLIASPQLQGSYFAETVILLTDHDSSGSIGLIINRPTSVKLSDLWPDITRKARGHVLLIGGPVARYQAFFLIQTRFPTKEIHHVLEDVYFGGSRKIFETFLQTSNLDEQFRVYLGYAGWEPGQLEQELLEGVWQVMAGNSAMIFQTEFPRSEIIHNFYKKPLDALENANQHL